MGIDHALRIAGGSRGVAHGRRVILLECREGEIGVSTLDKRLVILEARWSGRLAYQEVVEIPVSVTLPGEQGGFVRTEVEARLPDGRTFNNATSVYVDPGTPDSPAPESRNLVGMNGETIPVVIYKNPEL